MRITVMTAGEQIITLDVDSQETVENVKALLEVESNVPIQQQQLLYNGNEMGNSDKLSALGVKDDDLLMMMVSNASSGATSAAGSDLGMNPDGSALNPAAFQQHIRGDSNLMGQLFQNDPELAQVISGSDLNKLQDVLRARHRQRSVLQRQKEEELALLYADPFDVEAQKKIEAAIRQKGIDENWEAALEHNPEGFARVIMLYVDMEVNGVPLKAFVDSGAQSTIISKSCAERCGLLRLMDQRYKGIAHGVGQSEILGRIHVAPIKIGNNFYPCSFVVLDSPNMEFLFGLDMLRKHQCTIDLKENVMTVGGGEVSVPFLQEKDIPSRFLDEERVLNDASSSGATVPSGFTEKKNNNTVANPTSQQPKRQNTSEGPEFEAKIAKLVELGFSRDAVIQALRLFEGNEEQAAGFLFGG
ncbi:DNA damage-inducible protein 1 isoform X2 [Arabidopsis lyrata subsp. lyrata]|uniref:DNA damage-inducible protein 1 isoform X2 n=1 Tax=Arabidopsis lyrata subsp. lyrata TaxID=81972 RepID=UPI000A29AF27|nr:DNA damage-inducible protein 1 isoform X2 [Arabidopsis lyrata subsp. lyrata]|eukprot:XP_020887696.1 DNA damage-inducible protein 1 isoform X2 [Arabidopsis lyrata subsp. lyrata]